MEPIAEPFVEPEVEPEIEAVTTIKKVSVAIQTDKRQVSEKQRQALKNGREQFAKDRIKYKEFCKRQAEEFFEKKKSVPVEYNICFI